MRPKVILLVGLPGSGKSTWAAGRKLPMLSSDLLRELLLDDVTDQSANGAVFRMLRRMLVARLELRRPVTCIDATNLTRRERRPYCVLAAMYGAEVEAIYFDIPGEVCRARNRARNRNVPEEAMDRLEAKLQPPAEAEGFTRILRIVE